MSGSGTTELVFGYTVVSGDDDDNGLFLRDESDYNNPDGPVRLDSDDEIEFKDTSTDAPLYWSGRGTQSGHKVDGSRTTGNNPPSFSSSATLSIPENTDRLTVVAEDSDTDDDITGYAITGGADNSSFSSVSSSGELQFVNDPNFENPQDSGADNTYEVTVQATSGTSTREMTATRTFTVTVTDVAEQSAKPDKPTLAAVSGSSTSLTATWEAPGQERRPGDHRLRPAIQGEHGVLVGGLRAHRHGSHHDHHRADGGHVLSGAGAGQERRDGQRLVGRLGRGEHKCGGRSCRR